MDKRSLIGKAVRFVKFFYYKLFRIHDSPQRIALGFGLGVFTGLMPGTGLTAALLLAVIFRVNRAGALIGCLVFNTWAGIVIFSVSLKTGALVMGMSERAVYEAWNSAIKDFTWHDLWHASLSAIMPLAAGYFIISLAISAVLSASVFILLREVINSRNNVNSSD